MRSILFVLLCFICVSIFANPTTASLICDKAPSVSDPTYCSRFKEIAICHCQVDGIPSMCGSMKEIYTNMISYFTTLKRACDWQQKKGSEIRTTSAECRDNWNCYWGSTPDGSCSIPGLRCE